MTQEEICQLQLRASEGDADSQFCLAMMHIYGSGVAEDNALAFDLLQRSAAQCHTEATYNLGICYHYGHGTDVNLPKAFQLYMKSALAGYGKGMELIGRFYNRGIGVARDRALAERWLYQAIASSDPEAREEALTELNIHP